MRNTGITSADSNVRAAAAAAAAASAAAAAAGAGIATRDARTDKSRLLFR